MTGLLRYFRRGRRACAEPRRESGGFDTFTGRARRVLVLAQEEAGRLQHNYLGTEHLLLGLLAEEGGIAGRALGDLSLTLAQARQAVEAVVGRGDEAAAGALPVTPRAKRVLELAGDEARGLGHAYLGTEHLLLALSREGDGIGARVLVRLGAPPARVRERVLGHLTRR